MKIKKTKTIKKAEINFVPMNDKLLVRLDNSMVVMEGAEPPKSGEVLVLGTDPNFKVQVGSRVFWNYGGREVEIDGEKYLVISESELLGYQK